MKTTRASLTLVSLFLAACAADTADPGVEAVARTHLAASGVPRGHLLPMPGEGLAARRSAGSAQSAHMVYRGGPVISGVKVYTVFWSPSVPNQSALNGFYATLVNGPYVDLLAEYDTPTQNIGRGKYIGSYVDGAAPSGSTLSDDQIRQELARLLDNGSLPAADANTLFMIHFPAGVSITMDSNTSCQQFCAYHSSFTHGSGAVYYGIMPDFSGACGTCGGESTQLAGTTVVASHEVAEAMTDPNIGVANQSQDEHQLGWYDDTNSEIGDVCEGQSATVEGYRVTKLWSNKANACAVTGVGSTGGGVGGGGTGTGAGAGAGAGAGGGGGGGSATCAHALCTAGAALDGTCDPCAAKICQKDGYCCSGAWDRECVADVQSICTQSTCGGGSGAGGGSGGHVTGESCSHPLCATGAALTPTCGPCTHAICDAKPECCTSAWTASCVHEAAVACGKHCP